MNWLGLAILLLEGLAIVFFAGVLFVVVSLTRPPRRGYAYAVSRGLPGTPAELGPPLGVSRAFEEWTFRSQGMDLRAWDIPGDDANGPVAIFTHGWGSSRVRSLLRVPGLAAVCSRMVLWDLPGHGDSPGSCSLGTREVDDLLALIEVVAGRGARSGGARPVVLVGSSLGAGISIAAAARSGPGVLAGVIAQAPYRTPIVPAANVLRERGFPVGLVLPVAVALVGLRWGEGVSWASARTARRFDRLEHARRVRVPLLVVHGSADTTAPLEDGRAIATAAPSGRLEVIEGGGHNDLWTDERWRANMIRILSDFLKNARS